MEHNMNKIRRGIISLIILIVCITTVSATPPIPESYWGYATLNGAPAPYGTSITVEVYGTGEVVGSTTVQDPNGGYSLDVGFDDPDTPEDEGANEGDQLTWKMNGIECSTPAPGTDTATPGGRNDNFNVAATSEDNPPSVTVLHPGGGESIPLGTQVQVSAHATDDTAVTSVTFSYSNNSGSDWNSIGAGTRVSGTDEDGIWNRTWNTNSLGAGSNYLIRAVADDGTSTREDRSDSTFSLTCTPPSAPALNDPGTTDTDGSYAVSWGSVSGATSYMLEEDMSGSFGSPTVVYSGSGTSTQITDRSNGTYYYRVKACNACGCSGWSNVEDIEVLTGGKEVCRNLPSESRMAGDIITVSLDVTVGSATYYLVDEVVPTGWTVVSASGGGSIVLAGHVRWSVISGVTDTTLTYNVQIPHGASGTYTFGTGEWLMEGMSNPAPIHCDTVVMVCAPPTPTLSDSGTTDPDGSYTVSWSSVSGATSYTLEEDTSGLFGSPTVVYSGSGTSTQITDRSNGTYYYRVKACNACGCSGWSNVEDIEVSIPDLGGFPADWVSSDPITIHENSGSDLTNYQILVELNASNFDFSKAQPDGADIRFAELDKTLLDYWIEDWDSTDETAKVWVMVPNIPASGTATIRMWYGNAGADDVSDGAAVFEFFDDFEDGDFTNNPVWEEVQCPYASITTIDDDHWIKLFRVGNCDSPAYKTSGAFDLSQSFAITYKLRLSSGDQTGGGLTLGTNDGYVLYNIGLNTGHWNAAETGPESWSSGFGYDTAKTKTKADFRVEYFEHYFYFASGNTGLSRETNHNIKLIYTASNHNWELFVDGEAEGNIIGSTEYDADISEIHISGKSATSPGNGVYFNDIIVRKYTSPAPTVTVKYIGDLNSDGTLTPADAAIALQLAATGGWDPAADVDGDSRITSLDALMILQAAAGTIAL